MAVNWVLGEEAGCSMNAVEEFGGLGVTVVAWRCAGKLLVRKWKELGSLW